MATLEDWLGRQISRTETIDHAKTDMLAVTLAHDAPEIGDPLPPCWHWAWFNDVEPASQLGRDGHPKRGDFIPPITLPRRMWAGGEIEFLEPVIIGQEATKTSTIEALKNKNGSTGDLVILTIHHQLSQDGILRINEQQNLVFRSDPGPDVPVPDLITPPQSPDQKITLTPDPVMMFRYSALTFNGHRIHYDVDYARDIEGYPDLVFHAPITATLLCKLGWNPSVVRRKFTYRATAPLFCNQPIRICAKTGESNQILWAETPQGNQAMIANLSDL